eukprot:1698477-Amphidinium_carterae.1
MAASISLDGADLSSSCCGLDNTPSTVSTLSTPSCRQKSTKCFSSTTPDALQAPDAVSTSSQ